MIERLLAKAERALATATRDLANGDPDAAANRCYYAVYYAAWAMFVAHGLERPKTHSGLIAEFGHRFVKKRPVRSRDRYHARQAGDLALVCGRHTGANAAR